MPDCKTCLFLTTFRTRNMATSSTNGAVSKFLNQYRDRYECSSCKGSLVDPENLPCGCKCCGRCYYKALRASSPDSFKCPVCLKAMTKNEVIRKQVRKFLYSPRGVASFPDNGYAKVHTDAAAVEIVKYASSERRFYAHKTFHARYRITKGGVTQTISKPWDVAVSAEKELFITNGTPFIHVYDEDGQYKRRFAAITPDGGASNELCDPPSALHGITVNENGEIMVGDTNYKYISVLTTKGFHVQSFNIQISPKFLASTPLNQVVVSSCKCGPVDIVDLDTECTVKSIFAPESENAGQWCPTGVCCSWDEEEILIANQLGKVGIYGFSLEGTFLDFYEDYNDIHTPWGIAVSEDEKYLFVSNSDRSGKSIYETDKDDESDEADDTKL